MSWRNGNGKVRKDQTDPYGRIHEEITPFIENFEDSDSIKFTQSALGKVSADLQDDVKEVLDNALTDDDIASSTEIVKSVDPTDNTIKFNLENNLSNKINNSLQIPLTTPTATELVGIGTDKAQKRIKLSNRLKVENNELKVLDEVPLLLRSNYDHYDIDFNERREQALQLLDDINNEIIALAINEVKKLNINIKINAAPYYNDDNNINMILNYNTNFNKDEVIYTGNTIISNNSYSDLDYRNYYLLNIHIRVLYLDEDEPLVLAYYQIITKIQLDEENTKIKELESKYNVLQEQYINVLSEIQKLKEGGH